MTGNEIPALFWMFVIGALTILVCLILYYVAMVMKEAATTVAESRFRNIYRPAAHPVGLWNGGDVSDFLPHSRLDTGEWLHGRSCQQERGDTQRLQCCILV